MKIKTSKLTGPALDWAVAKCEGRVPDMDQLYWAGKNGTSALFNPSTNWAQGGPIIERELIDIQAKFNSGNNIVPKGQWYWQASTVNEDDVAYWLDGPTPLIAAMRCYCCAILGEFVDIPEELI